METRLLTSPSLWYNPVKDMFITGITDNAGYAPRLFRRENGFLKSEEKLCSDCGEDWTVSAGGRFLLYVPPADPRSIRLLDVETKQTRVWLSHQDHHFKYLQTIGDRWICVGVGPQGKTPATMLIPWRPEAAPPESDWRPEPTDKQLKAAPSLSVRFVRPHYYFIEKTTAGERMMHFHLDPVTLRLTAPKPVDGWDKLTAKPAAEHPWDIGADGIVFQLNEARGDIWLLRREGT